MKYFIKVFPLVAAAMLLMAVAPAHAAVALRFAPADTTIAPQSPARLAIFVDQAINLRTIEVTASYDTSVISSVDGNPGFLFTDTDFLLWSDFEEDTPGTWHGYCVVLGSEDYITGPGELYAWDIMGKAEGTSAITVQEVRLFDPAGTLIPDTTLPPANISIDQVVADHSVPDIFPGKMTTTPNPFNPRTNIQFELPEATSVFLGVFDARGRQVTVLMDQYTEAGIVDVAWNGKNSAGLEQPGGVYFFLMESDLGRGLAKAVLIK